MVLPERRIEELQRHLMLFFTGTSRIASEVAKSTIDNIRNKTAELTRIRAMVREAIAVLQSPTTPIEEFGRLLAESWEHKRALSDKVSTPEIDAIYAAGRRAVAIGGKLLGAGAGGFFLLFAQPERHPSIREALAHLVHVPFRFENGGSRVVLYQPDGF